MAEEIGFENGIQTFKVSWPGPWPWIRPYGIPSCITHRPLPIYQISFKSKKLFVDGRTYGRTAIFPPILLGRLPTFGSRPKKWPSSIPSVCGAWGHGSITIQRRFVLDSTAVRRLFLTVVRRRTAVESKSNHHQRTSRCQCLRHNTYAVFVVSHRSLRRHHCMLSERDVLTSCSVWENIISGSSSGFRH